MNKKVFFKLAGGLLLVVMSLLGSTISSTGAATHNSDTGAIGFYGKYVFPDTVDPEPPSSVTKEPVIPETTQSGFKFKGALPQTGEGTSLLQLSGGLIILISLSSLIYYKKRKKEKI